MRRPVIGITCSRGVGGRWGSYSRGLFMDFVFDAYSQAVLACGGAPLLVPITQNRESLLSLCQAIDGLILSGGPDVHPRAYRQEPQAGLGEIDEAADRMEMAAASLALSMDLPLLGICRGIQVLNVALKGTLYQDLSERPADPIHHFQSADRCVPTHKVRIASSTRLRTIVQRRTLWVNSRHHQAIKDLAAGLVASAHAGDGLIEAVELPGHRFAIGVQWHPEGLWEKDRASKRLFKALVNAAAGNQ